MLAEHVRVDPQRDGRISVAEPRGHHVHRDPGQDQGGRMQVTQIMQACVRQASEQARQPRDDGLRDGSE